MSRLGREERAVFQAVRARCRAGLSSSALRGAVASQLAQYLRADAFCAMELDPVTALPVHHVNEGWPEGYVEPLVERALWVSPLGDTATLLRNRRRAVSCEELLGGTSFARDAYFQFHILPYGYRYEAQLHCQSDGTPRALFTFNRRAGAGGFEPRQLRLLEALAPHIGAAIHAASVREALQAPTPADVGFIVLDQEGRAIHAGGVGTRLLSMAGTDGSSLGFRVFLSLIRRALREPASALPPPLVLSDPATRAPYRLIAERSTSIDGAPSIGILIEPSRPGDPSGLARLGLTPREIEVTAALLRGERFVDCAHALQCSPGTVAQHAKHVFAKLGVTSRRELAVRLLAHGWRGEPGT
jgi:DNA-binding CsgD family transcriptional regulator